MKVNVAIQLMKAQMDEQAQLEEQRDRLVDELTKLEAEGNRHQRRAAKAALRKHRGTA